MFFNLFNNATKVQHKAVVLLYHRIADCKIDPWQLSVSPLLFEKQLQVLKKKFHVISVGELVQQLIEKNISKNTVCITFDDGYLDNYLIAKPLLEKYNCPATFFIATENLVQQKPFWWDELLSILLEEQELDNYTCHISGIPFFMDMKDDRRLTPQLVKKHVSWTWPTPPPTQRSRLYLEIWQKLKPLPLPEIEKVITCFRDFFQIVKVTGSDCFPMSTEQLKTMAANPLFSIGVHTVTHPSLPNHNEEVQRNEILNSRLTLETICNIPITTIGYPYGDYNDTTLALARELNLNAGFTTRENSIVVGINSFCLGRMVVPNIDVRAFESKLRYHFNA